MLESMSAVELLLVALIIAIAYLVRGITGFGSGLVAMPLLVLIVPLSLAVPVILILDYVASVSHGLYNRQAIVWRDIFPLLPFILVGIVVAIYLFTAVDAALLSKSLGVFIICFAIYSLLPLTLKGGGNRLWAIPAGGLAGLIGTLFGTGGPFYVIYLKLRGHNKTEFRATFAAIFLLDGAARMLGYLGTGFYTMEFFILTAVTLPVMLGALYIGGHIHTKLSQQTFQQAISVMLLGSGLVLIFR